jgi:hypothetical protein
MDACAESIHVAFVAGRGAAPACDVPGCVAGPPATLCGVAGTGVLPVTADGAEPTDGAVLWLGAGCGRDASSRLRARRIAGLAPIYAANAPYDAVCSEAEPR